MEVWRRFRIWRSMFILVCGNGVGNRPVARLKGSGVSLTDLQFNALAMNFGFYLVIRGSEV